MTRSTSQRMCKMLKHQNDLTCSKGSYVSKKLAWIRLTASVVLFLFLFNLIGATRTSDGRKFSSVFANPFKSQNKFSKLFNVFLFVWQLSGACGDTKGQNVIVYIMFAG